MNAKINNPSTQGLKITHEIKYSACRLLTLFQVENVLRSNCNYVLLYVGEEVNFLYCDPISKEETAKEMAAKTDGIYLTRDEFKSEIKPRLVGL